MGVESREYMVESEAESVDSGESGVEFVRFILDSASILDSVD